MPTLQWLTRDADVRAAEKVPYRLLEEVLELGYGDRDAGNMLIQGDNLEALKSLLPFYAGQVKCIYIDPPYNTGSAFEHYEDNLEHSKWLAMIWPRLELLRELLSDDGVFWVQIDDKQDAYLRILCDELFGRKNFLNRICVKTSDPSGHKTVNPSPYSQTEYVLMYAASRHRYVYEQRYVESVYDPGYGKLIQNRDEHFSDWKICGLNQHVAKELGFASTKEANAKMGKVSFGLQVAQFALENCDAVFQATAISNDAGKEIVAVREKSKKDADKVLRFERDGYDDVFCLNGRQVYFYASKLREIDGVVVPAKPLTNLWADIPWNGISNEGGVKFKNGKKPERLVERCIELTTNPGDLVLDSFLGSGTTGAVAQKMGRRYIGIEMGDHAETHCQPRLQKVVDGEQGGISKAHNWQGGGGFRYYRLGSAVFDELGQIQPDIRFSTLAAHIWFSEFSAPSDGGADGPFLGAHKGSGLALLYNGILGDKSVNGGNVLTRQTLKIIRNAAGDFDGPLVIYGERTVLVDASLDAENIVFKQTPYDVRARK